MGRTITLLVALAAFVAACAHAAPDSAAKSHRRASGSETHGRVSTERTRTERTHARHTYTRESETSKSEARTSYAGHSYREARSRESAGRGTRASRASGTDRRTPEEVGRAAGLRIRRQMEERRVIYRRRMTRESRYRRARLVEARYRAPRPEPVAEPVAEPMAESMVDTPGTARDSEMARDPQTARYAEQPQAALPAPAAPQPYRSDESAAPQTQTHELSRPEDQPKDQPAAEGDNESAGEPAVEPPESDVASLAIPRGAMPPPLKGSLASLERQNERLTAEGLERIENESDLAARIADHLLVPVPVSDALTVNSSLPLNHRYCRPWTARFLADLARDHEAIFHRPLEVSSAVRTVEYQERLMRINGNAAPAEGDIVNPHLTGATIDIAKEGLTRDEMKWMRHRLLQLEEEGKIDVEEEFQQSCFHITVYKTYAPSLPLRRATRPQPGYAPQAPQPENDGSDTEGL